MAVEILWVNGTFGVGKSHTVGELHHRMQDSIIFDPELIGFGIQKSVGREFIPDFQDFHCYRSGVVETLLYMSQRVTGTILVPMALYKEAYFQEIITELRARGTKVRHIVLCAEDIVIKDRLRRRNFGLFRYFLPKKYLPASEGFAIQKMQEINSALQELPADLVIHTDTVTLTEVVELIAQHCGYTLQKSNDQLQFLRKMRYTIKNIRI